MDKRPGKMVRIQDHEKDPWVGSYPSGDWEVVPVNIRLFWTPNFMAYIYIGWMWWFPKKK